MSAAPTGGCVLSPPGAADGSMGKERHGRLRARTLLKSYSNLPN
jgi:hypothetical protein